MGFEVLDDADLANLRQRMMAYELAFGSFTLKELEWSGYRRGPGDGPHGSGFGGSMYDACPTCGGLKEPNNSFIRKAVGHRHSCKLAKLLGSKRNPPTEDEEQEEMF